MLHNTLHIQSNNYNASTNTPALTTTTGYNDNIFQVTTQGIQTINGVSSFCGVGDQIIVSNAVSQFYVVLPVQYNAATGAVGALAVTITQLQQVGRIITISVAGTQTINGVSVAMVVGQAWEYNGSSWLNITNPFATQAQVNAGVVNNLPLAPSTFAASSQLAALAPLASPAFTGIPTAPTAALGTNTTQVASTAFVLANANTSDSYATQAQVNAGVVSNLAIAPSTFAASSQLAALAPLASPAFTGIPTAPTAALGTNTTQVASTAFVLANANTSDSYATQAQVNAGVVSNLAIAPSTFAASTQLAAKAPLASPALTGTPTVPTAAIGTNTTQAASTAFVIANANPTSSYASQAEVDAGTVTNKAVAPSTFAASTQLAAKAPLASPALTGTPTVPTAAIGTNTTQAASTAFVIANANPSSSYATQAQVNAGTVTNLAVSPSTFESSSQLAAKAPLASPSLTGTPTAPTAALGTNTTQLATTAFAHGGFSGGSNGYSRAANTLITMWVTGSTTVVAPNEAQYIPITFPITLTTRISSIQITAVGSNTLGNTYFYQAWIASEGLGLSSCTAAIMTNRLAGSSIVYYITIIGY